MKTRKEKMLNITHYQRIQTKATIRFHLMPVKWLQPKSLQTINAGEGVEKREPSYTVGGNAN